MTRTSTVSTHNRLQWWRQIIWSCQAMKGILLVRYFLLRTPWFGIYLHHFCCSDEDRALHDHPWAFVTIPLTGGYWEHTPTGRYWRRPWRPYYRPATWQHRVELVKPVWTFVVRGPIERAWGFWLPVGWMHWKDYGKQYCD